MNTSNRVNTQRVCLSLFFLVSLLLTGVQSYIYKIPTTTEIAFRSSQYAPGSYNSPPGDGRSIITIDTTYSTQIDEQDIDELIEKPATADILIFNYKDEDYLGVDDIICCTQSLYNDGKCSTPGAVALNFPNTTAPPTTITTSKYMLNQTSYESVTYFRFLFTDISSTNNIDYSMVYNVSKEGVYYVFLVQCSETFNYTQVYFNGQISFLNPYGYLPAEIHPYLGFYLTMSLSYVLVSSYWVFHFYKHRKSILPLQYWISLVILLGFLESITSYGTYSATNKSGQYKTISLVIMNLFATCRGAVSRLIVLVLSMGYGVIIPTIPRVTKYKIGLITILYCIFRSIQNYITLIPRPTTSNQVTYVFMSLPVSILDTIFYYWIFLSFTRVFSRLSLKRQQVKLQMYQRFFVILFFSLIASVLFIILQMIIQRTKTIDGSWKINWIFFTFWDFLYLLILTAMAYIWKPNQNNDRIAYNEVVDEDDTADVVLQPIGFGTSGLSRRTSIQSHDSDGNRIQLSDSDDEEKEERERRAESQRQRDEEIDNIEEYKREITKGFDI